MLLTLLPISMRNLFLVICVISPIILYALALQTQPADRLNYSIFTILSSILFLNIFKIDA